MTICNLARWPAPDESCHDSQRATGTELAKDALTQYLPTKGLHSPMPVAEGCGLSDTHAFSYDALSKASSSFMT